MGWLGIENRANVLRMLFAASILVQVYLTWLFPASEHCLPQNYYVADGHRSYVFLLSRQKCKLNMRLNRRMILTGAVL